MATKKRDVMRNGKSGMTKRFLRTAMRACALWGGLIILALGRVIFEGGAAQAAALDPTKAEDVIKIQRKLICWTLTDAQPRQAVWQGNVYSRVPGEKDRLIFKVVGVNTRQCASAQHPDYGEGFRSVSREVMLYLDPDSGEVLRRWTNPWTGQEVEVVHVANDPVNMRAPMYARGPKGTPLRANGRVMGDMYVTANEFPLFYPNPLGGAYQKYVGGMYQAIELFNNFTNAEELLDADKVDAPRVYIAWVRVSQWLPWMEMGGRPGYLIFNTQGSTIDSLDEMPDILRTELEANYPIYFSPPPVDDDRPNDTSWTVFKRWIDERRASEADGR